MSSSYFVRNSIWKQVKGFNPNILLIHARAATLGIPTCNKNNHPFVTSSGTTALIHNGRIPSYDQLVSIYEVASECDSEILLRIYEREQNHLSGVRSIWALSQSSFMAVGIGDRLLDGVRRLTLFRNRFRSLWLADLRDVLGQVFFFSTPSIWMAAKAKSSLAFLSSSKYDLIEMQPNQVWIMEVSEFDPVVTSNSLKKYKVVCSGEEEWNGGDMFKIVSRPQTVKMITGLDETDKIIKERS